ncbi:hypothetical protein BHU72_07450 [Desulfuribacillus stibiiarsenatis]|uniref:Isoprenylcysteine carboxylmethyltransferase family protein n=1 Tax=Desulfuribacillus stibiiarsenatis TaxID=1390249 RepID=A0A1E5L4S6_9FIRM|nr:isoprenylcysteine carboxylmethyltransferase family protein [Desulfuribacillus stibiiarsenatis]OEH85013.1 hypothetical protein BHU72_07450 [Desulfuribacillus stibiiarsenatis]
MSGNNKDATIKGSFWGATIFYVFIAFEFLYMASPFAIYFYSAYNPALDFFNQSVTWSWMISFFLPHIAKTSIPIFNIIPFIGGFLATLGFLFFCIGAIQVYYYKLAKKGAVTGGIYRYIRHPQYTSFIVCSFGLLLLWPRYIILIMFVTMLFAYYLLARVEERECEAKFGQSYLDYKNKTNMFIPIKFNLFRKIKFAHRPLLARIAVIFAIYIITVIGAIGLARMLDNMTLNSLYTYYTVDAAYISISEIDEQKMKKIIEIVTSNKQVLKMLERTNDEDKTKYLNYILPKEWYVSEIPMKGIDGREGVTPHLSPRDYDRDLYKVIFIKAEIRGETEAIGKDIITRVSNLTPIMEVWVNTASGEVSLVEELTQRFYINIPVAIY